jgi:hypothetical protein
VRVLFDFNASASDSTPLKTNNNEQEYLVVLISDIRT